MALEVAHQPHRNRERADMIRILDRMIIRSFFGIFLGFVLGSPLLFLVGDLVERVDNYFDNGLTVSEVATAYFFKVPQFIFWSFPTAALIAAVFTIHTMTVHREVLAAKAGGISFRRLMVPILAVGIVLSGAALWLSEVYPVAELHAGRILGRINIDQQWRSDFVFRTDDGGALTVRRLRLSDRTMQGVTLSIPTGSEDVTKYIQAESAVFSDSIGWTFHTGYVREVYLDRPDRTTVYDSLVCIEHARVTRFAPTIGQVALPGTRTCCRLRATRRLSSKVRGRRSRRAPELRPS